MEFLREKTMKQLEVRHFEDELTEEEIKAWEDTQRSDDYDSNTRHEQ